ncbi:type II toxin-antitoxin system VapC family toxin [Oscillatoria sp. FACHB-1406]|uniref:type II toxin-antitoxin system VapC family toxin n=1 Tax=Oscillatoria sp. FACHB-1406 TaxID=2692846 RepID=UPI001683EFAC|nr:type II toxin-antitoxin system VapC family toxin [Oscillatoria sp. FACHB-1406]MBD2579905.1 type II toxin-antitoxin system VapC family toxin [Oscillatoria sp. FACHB-1406]
MTASLRCVLDTNICIKLFIDDPLTPKVDLLFDHLNNPSTEFFVPDLFYIECANTLWKYVRANLYTAARVREDLNDLKALRLQVTPTKHLMTEAVQIGLDYGITAYDGCYVALSERVNAPLLTLDERLVNSLKSSRFNVVSFTTFLVPPLPS